LLQIILFQFLSFRSPTQLFFPSWNICSIIPLISIIYLALVHNYNTIKYICFINPRQRVGISSRNNLKDMGKVVWLFFCFFYMFFFKTVFLYHIFFRSPPPFFLGFTCFFFSRLSSSFVFFFKLSLLIFFNIKLVENLVM